MADRRILLTLAGGAIAVLLCLLLPLAGVLSYPVALALAALFLAAQVGLVWRLLQRQPVRPQEMQAYAGDWENPVSFDATLRIGDETMPYLREGLNMRSAQKITDIIQKITEADAVAITDTEQILGFSGTGCRRHHQGGPILTTGTRRVLASGKPMIVDTPGILACDEPDCPHPLKTAIIVPLKFRGEVAGTFKIYRTVHEPFPPYIARLAVITSQLLGLQMELAEANRQRQLVTKTRLEALQAQIRPHFLFNILNTIISVSRFDGDRARELLVQLASFFRRSLSYRENFITLQDEIDYIQTYLSLEKARFGDKLQVRMRLDPRILGQKIPVLTVQPLVENAVLHGLAPREEGGTVCVSARRLLGEIRVTIIDNGIGMSPERIRAVFEEGFSQNLGIGMSNVNERLLSLYGHAYKLRLKSRPGRGTAVRLRIPLPGADSPVSAGATAGHQNESKAEGTQAR